MKRLILVGVLTISLLACGDDPQAASTNTNNWSFIKSPLTGRCYEFFNFTKQEAITRETSVGFSGMAEVPCSYLER